MPSKMGNCVSGGGRPQLRINRRSRISSGESTAGSDDEVVEEGEYEVVDEEAPTS